MSLFKKRPQLQKLEYVSPPPTDDLHIFPHEDTPTQDRAAKRQRIEDYARDYLKGRNVFIATAGLKGPFDNGWKNPWRANPVEQTPVEEHEPQRQRVVPETDVRPVSRAGSDYCHDWLRRQDVEEYSPDSEHEVENDVQHEGEATPSRRERKRQKTVHLPVEPAWSRSIRSDLPTPHPQPNSLQVDIPTSIAKRSISEQPARPPQQDFRNRFRSRPDPVHDSGFMKVSAITEDFPPPKKTRPPSRQTAAVESPGFPFRRVGATTEGKRPFSRGSELSKASTTQLDHPSINDHIWVSVARTPAPAPAPAPEEECADDIESVPDEDGEVITIAVNVEGKWPCPVKQCAKRPKPYASASGLRKHLKSKHGKGRVVVEQASRAAARGKTRSVEPVLDLAETRVGGDVVEGEEAAVATEERVAGHEIGEPVLDAAAEVPARNERVSSPPTVVHAAPEPITHNEAAAEEHAPAAPTVSDEQDSVIVPDIEENTMKASDPAPPPAAEISTTTDPPVPDRQDSRAYSTFTFNTQAALLQAHQAFFQDTQEESPQRDTVSSPAKLASISKPGKKADETPAPPRRPDIPSFFQRSAVQPASTQDLMNAAADLSFSTVKKPTEQKKKRISFADWGQSKPSQPMFPVNKEGKGFESQRAVEWSPFTDTPGGRGQSKSQDTPVRSILAGKRAEGMKRSALSFSHTYTSPAVEVASNEQFAQIPKSSDVPLIPSFTPAQREGASGDLETSRARISHEVEEGREGFRMDEHGVERVDGGGGMSSLEIEHVLDEAESFLSTWDVDKEVARNTGVVRV